jgi:hypothetical protein
MNKRVERTNCDRKKRRHPGPAVKDLLSAQDKDMANLETEEQVCAAVLATDMAKVYEEIGRPDSMAGRVRAHADRRHSASIGVPRNLAKLGTN